MWRAGVVLAMVGPLAGCNLKLVTLKVSESAQTTVEKGTLLETLIGDFGFDDFLAMDITTSSELENQGVGPGDVKDVRLTLFELEALDPANADLSFLERIDVFVESPDLPQVLLASADAFPPGDKVVVFELEDVDLTEYAVSQSLTLTTDIEGLRPPEDTLVEARFELAVGVTGQGIANNL